VDLDESPVPPIKIKAVRSRFILLEQLSHHELTAGINWNEVIPSETDERFFSSMNMEKIIDNILASWRAGGFASTFQAGTLVGVAIDPTPMTTKIAIYTSAPNRFHKSGYQLMNGWERLFRRRLSLS
jgi:hypothetical protein